MSLSEAVAAAVPTAAPTAPGQSLGLFLWEASTVGDHSSVEKLLKVPEIDVNWADEELRRTPLYRASGHGAVEVVKLLLKDPRVLVNLQQTQGGTPLGVACQQGYVEVVKLLLNDPRVSVELVQREGCSPFYIACSHKQAKVVQVLLSDPRININSKARMGSTPIFIASQEGATEVVKLLLKDPRVDVNAPMVNGETPLWIAAQRGHLDVVKLILASDKPVQLGNRWKRNGLNEEEQARHSGHTAIADLLREFAENRKAVQHRLLLEMGVLHTRSAEVLALTVLYVDDYFTIRSDCNETEGSKFFRILSRLPLELQMSTCNLLHGVVKPHILSTHLEPAFRKFLLE